jgi:hypothetical protein
LPLASPDEVIDNNFFFAPLRQRLDVLIRSLLEALLLRRREAFTIAESPWPSSARDSIVIVPRNNDRVSSRAHPLQFQYLYGFGRCSQESRW